MTRGFVVVAWLLSAMANAAEPVRIPLVSVAKNLGAKPLTIAVRDHVPKCPTPMTIRVERLHGGKQEGVDLIHIDNGRLVVTLIPTRGMGIQQAKLGDFALGWRSPVNEIVHPQWVNLQARGGLGWLDGFTEMMCRCGLENNGQPGQDMFVNNVGDKATMDLTLHGKIANLPAQEVEAIVETEAPFRLTIRGVVHERMLFGPKLELAAEWSTEPGSNGFRLRDVVTNRGAQPQEFQMLYHVNWGAPLLGKGARFLAAIDEVTPFNANAARDVATWNEYLGPTPGYVEQVYLCKPRGDAKGKSLALLRNAAGDRAASVAYDVKELPCLTLWKNTGAEADGYVTGVEPGTNYPNRRVVERAAGRVPMLAGGESRTMTVAFRLHTTAEEVNRAEGEVRTIQGEVRPAVRPTPP